MPYVRRKKVRKIAKEEEYTAGYFGQGSKGEREGVVHEVGIHCTGTQSRKPGVVVGKSPDVNLGGQVCSTAHIAHVPIGGRASHALGILSVKSRLGGYRGRIEGTEALNFSAVLGGCNKEEEYRSPSRTEFKAPADQRLNRARNSFTDQLRSEEQRSNKGKCR